MTTQVNLMRSEEYMQQYSDDTACEMLNVLDQHIVELADSANAKLKEYPNHVITIGNTGFNVATVNRAFQDEVLHALAALYHSVSMVNHMMQKPSIFLKVANTCDDNGVLLAQNIEVHTAETITAGNPL